MLVILSLVVVCILAVIGLMAAGVIPSSISTTLAATTMAPAPTSTAPPQTTTLAPTPTASAKTTTPPATTPYAATPSPTAAPSTAAGGVAAAAPSTGFSLTNTGSVISITVCTADGVMYGVGTDSQVYYRLRTDSKWTNIVTNNCCASAIESGPDGKLGVVNNGSHAIYWKASNDVPSAWVLVNNSASLLDFTTVPSIGGFIGVGTDKILYSWNGNGWTKVAGGGVGNIIAVSCDVNGLLWAVATDNRLYKQTTAGQLVSGSSFTPTNTANVIGVACDRTAGNTSDVYVVNKDLTVSKFTS